MENVYKEAKKLHKKGFGILWIKPKSKMPVENGWTKGPRKSWDQLKKSFHSGMNVGVRLGSASQIDGKFLAAIDCDVKSEDPKHVKEMEEKLKELIGHKKTPIVISGRGNGSRHIYLRTAKPVRPKKWAQSQEKVKVKMPSVAPSKHELKILNESELKTGLRIRPAWEISVMGEGQQTVLPPSVHPDSNKRYQWSDYKGPIAEIDLNDALLAHSEEKNKVRQNHDVVEVDFMDPRFKEKTVDLILDGEDCSDRSAGLFIAAMDMLRSGFNEKEILSVLTEPETFLGECAYDHTKSRDRKRAMDWVYNYTLKKAMKETLAVEQFEVVEGEIQNPTLNEEDAKKQTEELAPKVEKHWSQTLDRSHDGQGPIKATFLNMIKILENVLGSNVFVFDEFAIQDFYGMDTPWGGKKGEALKDIDALLLKKWFSEKYKFEAPTVKVHEVINTIAFRNKYHPVREFLNKLEWDGKPRIDTWIKTYCGGTGPKEYLEAISRKFLVAMIARIYEPGKKFDHMLIFQGQQGSGKSTAFKILAGQWFSDTPMDPNDKDSVVNIQNVWLNEQGELSVLSKASIEALKRFITCREDKIRLPYGKRSEIFPRQVIFAGSTNKETYLTDKTGNRRFWPVEVGKTKFAELARDRDQLLAEAKFAYELGEPLYLESEVMEQQAGDVQDSKVFQDVYIEIIEDFFSKETENFPTDGFSIKDLFGDFGPFAGKPLTMAEQYRIADALKDCGFKKERRRRQGIGKEKDGNKKVNLWMKQS